MNLRKLFQSRFVRNTATLQFGAGLNAVSNFLSSVLVAHLLGAHKQGMFVVSISLYSLFFSLASIGVMQATVTQVAAAAARGKEQDADEAGYTTKMAQWLAFLAKSYVILGGGLLVIGYWALPALMEAVGEDRQLGVWAWWLTLSPILEMPRVVCQAAFQGTRRMLALAQTENATEIVRLFLVVTAAAITGGPEGPVIGTIATAGFGSVLAANLYWRTRTDGGYRLPTAGQIVRNIRTVPILRGMPLGIRMGLMRSANQVGLRIIPPLVIQITGNSAWVAYFRVAQSIVEMPRQFLQGVSRTALPALSELAGLKDMDRFRRNFLRVTLIAGTITGVGVLAGLPVIRILIGMFYPDDYLEPTWILCLILAAGFIVVAYTVALDAFYVVTDTWRVALRITFVILIWSVVAQFTFGLMIPNTGVAWGIVATMMCSFFHYGYIWWYFRQQRRARAVPAAAGAE